MQQSASQRSPMKRYSVAILALSIAVRAADIGVTNVPGAIGNSAVLARNANGEIALADRATGRVFASDFRLDGAGSLLREEAATDPVFGAGGRMVFDRKAADGTGGEVALEAYHGLPFFLVR